MDPEDGADDPSPAEEAGAAALPLWFEDLMPGGTGEGFLHKARRHSLISVRRSKPYLLVTFDNLSNVSDTTPERLPWAYKFARDAQVSHLGVMAHSKIWYRDAELIAAMERLAGDGAFDGFERVLFAGTSMGGFAALAFAALAPGSHAIAFSPQTTLDPARVPWEERFWSGRRQDWTLPLSDAADHLPELGRASVVYDPYFAPDRQHAERLTGTNVRHLKSFYSNHKSPVFLRKMEVLKPVMELALFDDLTEHRFYQLTRARRNLPWYRGTLAAYYDRTGRPEMSRRVTRAFHAAKRASDAPAIVPRRLKNDRRVIITTMKNEGPFMLEWIAYNRAIGFSDFMIFTNDCSDGTDRIAMRLEEMGLAHHYENAFRRGRSPQRAALRRGYREEPAQTADWLICADCDEFLNITVGDGTLDDLFAATGPTDAISFCWRSFGSSGITAYEDRFVTEQFTWTTPETYFDKYRATGLKTLFRPCDIVNRMGVHRPKFDNGWDDYLWHDAGGQRMPAAYEKSGWSAHRGFRHDFARLHHYGVRSAESFLIKRDRGRTNHVEDDQGLHYWADMNLNLVEDHAIAPRLPAARAAFDELMADPELARLHRAACDWHAGRIATLRTDPEWEAFFTRISSMNLPGEDPTAVPDPQAAAE